MTDTSFHFSDQISKNSSNFVKLFSKMYHSTKHTIVVMIERMETRKVLTRMSDRELEDIGINRVDINHIVKNIK